MKINPQDYIGKAIFITATNTNVGKTFASEVFLKYFAKNGLKVGYFKPIETGVIDNSPLDGLKMFELVKKLNPNFLKLTINDIVPYQFTLPASPYVAKGNTFLDIDFLIEKKLINNGFCPITGEKTDINIFYEVGNRKVFLSKNGLEVCKRLDNNNWNGDLESINNLLEQTQKSSELKQNNIVEQFQLITIVIKLVIAIISAFIIIKPKDFKTLIGFILLIVVFYNLPRLFKKT